jgi:hypothetical protein
MRRRLTFSLIALGALAAAALVPMQAATAAGPTPQPKPSAGPARTNGHGQSTASKALLNRAALSRQLSVAQPAVAPTPVRIPRLDARLQITNPAKDGTVRVALIGTGALAAAVRKVGGKIYASTPGAVSASVPKAALATLAGTAGVTAVKPPVRAFADVISQGVQSSGADVWQGAPNNLQGAGVKIGIVDAGFGDLAAEVTATNLPAGLTVAHNHCADVNGSSHGTAVAEIVHQMAPQAELILTCVDDSIGFNTAANDSINIDHVSVVNSSLGFPGDSRGDGTGALDSAANAVKVARKAGILWVQSSGNSALDHWGGTLRDANHDLLTDLNGTNDEIDAVDLFGPATLFLKWDQWPTSNLGLKIRYQQYGFDGTDIFPIGAITDIPRFPGQTDPVICVTFLDSTPDGCSHRALDPNAVGVIFSVYTGSNPPAIRYDLSYLGAVSDSLQSCTAYDVNGCIAPVAGAYSGSVAEPASSPYALGVGARYFGDNTLETYSSRGPTVDGRVKPDITGYDCTASNVSPWTAAEQNGFCGTSAAAPHVAGAAALVKGANPSMDAAQIQDFLERRATAAAGGIGVSPPTNNEGHGRLTLGSAALAGIAPPAGVSYQPLATPKRIFLSTNAPTATPAGIGRKLNPNETVTVTVPTGPDVVPADATAVAINLTGTGITQATFLSAYPGGVANPGTSNLNLAAGSDATAAVFAEVGLSGSHTISVYNNSGQVLVIVDVLGYFAPTAPGLYNQVAPQRILDTRLSDPTLNGGHPGRLVNGDVVTVNVPDATVPADATSVVVNLTSAGSTSAGYLTVSPDGSGATSTLNFNLRDRANLSVVGIQAGTPRTFKVRNTSGATYAIVDLVGYFSPSAGSTFVPLTSPVRIVDTRRGNGGRNGPLTAGAIVNVPGKGLFDVPYNAKALLTGVTAVPTTASFFAVYPDNQGPPANYSTLNFTAYRNVPNAAVANLSAAGGANVYNNVGSAHAIVDLFGYFN